MHSVIVLAVAAVTTVLTGVAVLWLMSVRTARSAAVRVVATAGVVALFTASPFCVDALITLMNRPTGVAYIILDPGLFWKLVPAGVALLITGVVARRRAPRASAG